MYVYVRRTDKNTEKKNIIVLYDRFPGKGRVGKKAPFIINAI